MRRQRGFTLIELLVAVAIIGVLVTLSVSRITGRPRAIDLAQTMSTRLGEAARKAVAAGAVRSDVALALGGARTQVRIVVGDGAGGTVITERLEEDPLPAATAAWEQLGAIALPRTIRVVGTRGLADLTGQGVETPAANGAEITIKCYPDGRCDGKTIYLETIDGRRKARVAVLPLGGSPVTFDRW
jgi:prepilin-type N-terminal cleavage/methylation domain-containing protein